MSYADFVVNQLVKQFDLTIDQKNNLYCHIPSITPRPEFERHLARTTVLALMQSTDKARWEFIIAPVLTEVWRLCGEQFGLFSGVSFDVEPESGLAGVCDYILTRSPEMLYVSAPVLLLVEAKNEDMRRDYAQCIAEMVAAQRFNARESSTTEKIYGAVTMGGRWKFLELEQSLVHIDAADYFIHDISKIIGILVHNVGGADAGAYAGPTDELEVSRGAGAT